MRSIESKLFWYVNRELNRKSTRNMGQAQEQLTGRGERGRKRLKPRLVEHTTRVARPRRCNRYCYCCCGADAAAAAAVVLPLQMLLRCLPHCTSAFSILPGVPCASLSMVIAKLFVLISHAASWLLRLRQVYCTLHHWNHSLFRFKLSTPKPLPNSTLKVIRLAFSWW